MKIAETVTFGGSGLDRAAPLRADPAALAVHLGAGSVVPVWRGKPLLAGALLDAPGWVAPDHPVLGLGGALVFLGIDEGVARFAQDVSAWAPEAGAEAVERGFFDPSEQRHPALPDDHAFAELRGVMTRLTARDAELLATAKAVLQWHASHGFCATCGAASVVAMGGWQRNCPACGAHHFPRTDPVVIMLVTHGNSLLVGRSPGWPEGMYSLLAGFVEPGETLEAAVRREVFEEAGVRLGAVGYLASQPWPFPASLMFGCRAEATWHGHRPRPGGNRGCVVADPRRDGRGHGRRTPADQGAAPRGDREFPDFGMACRQAGLTGRMTTVGA